MRLRLRRTIGGAIGKDHYGHKQGQWQKDSNGGTVEGEHGFLLQQVGLKLNRPTPLEKPDKTEFIVLS